MKNAAEILQAHFQYLAKNEKRAFRILQGVLRDSSRNGFYSGVIWCEIPSEVPAGVVALPGAERELDWSAVEEYAQLADAHWDSWFRKAEPDVERQLIATRQSALRAVLELDALAQLRVYLKRKGFTFEVEEGVSAHVIRISL